MFNPTKSTATGVLLMVLTLFFTQPAHPQNTCKVLLPAISLKYDGTCKKGLAEGIGKAQGTDEYTGSFKKGLPDGKGKYTWQSGNAYDGEWSKGEMNGIGRFSYKREGKKDSIVSGEWRNNIFQEQKKETFIVHQKTAHISGVEVKQRKSTNNNITINLTNSNAGSTFSTTPTGGDAANWQQIPPPKLTDITVMTGFYDGIQKNKENARSTATTLSQIKYPFRIKIEISDQNLEIEFLEPGDYSVNITLDNKFNPDITNTPLVE